MNLSTNFWGGAAAPYEIEQSLRFVASSSSRLTRTPSSSGNMKTWTLSMWVKKWNTNIDGKYLWAAGVWSSGNTNTGQYWTGPNKLASVNGVNGVNNNGGATTPGKLYRDPSAWFHLVVRMDTANATASNRHRIYVNGELLTSASSVTQNFEGAWNRNVNHAIGGNNNHGTYSDVYIAEVHNVDGQSLDPTSFGEFDDNGAWRPIEYTGTYGTNGFYLKMDPSATNGVGHDHSGNGNHFTASGLTTSGTGTDVFSDTPTNNWCTWNPLDSKRDDGSLNYPNDGNLYTRVNSSGNYSSYATTIGFLTSGKWYFEYVPVRGGNNNSNNPEHRLTTKDFVDSSSSPTGITMNCGTQDGDGGTYMVAIDMDNGYVYRGRNGTWSNSGDPTSGSSGTGNVKSFTAGTPYRLTIAHRYDTGTSAATHNFGQRAFAYTPPTGYSTLNTSNLPAPDIADGSQYFEAITYTGDGNSTQQITTSFEPDFVWNKSRNQGFYHRAFDRLRGTLDKALYPSATFAEDHVTDYGEITATSATSVTVGQGGDSGNLINQSGYTHVLWNWLAGGSGSSNTDGSITSTVSANPTAGFSIVNFTGTGSALTVGHGLGVAPDMMIAKNRDKADNWVVWHNTFNMDNYFYLDNTQAKATTTNPLTFWNNTAPTSTVVSIGANSNTNVSGNDTILYCFAEVEGYSKFGSYVGNGSSDGPFIYTGFAPAMVILKSSSNSNGWIIMDRQRDSYNLAYKVLRPDSNAVENTNAFFIDFLSNGFKVRDAGGQNISGWTNIWAAFAEHPFGGDGVSPATAR